MTTNHRAALADIYATLPPTAYTVRIECLTDAQVAVTLERWQRCEAALRAAQAATAEAKKQQGLE